MIWSIQKDQIYGEINLIKSRIVPINEIISKVVTNIKREIDNTPEVLVQIDMAKVTGISILSNIGPKYNIRMECVRWGKYKFIFGIYR